MHEFFQKIDIFSNIVFDEEWHSYMLNGKRTVSVTKVTGSITPPFDKEKKAAEKAARLTEEGNPTTAEQLIDEWDLNNTIAKAKGSAVHKYIEMTLANKVQNYPLDIVEHEFNKCVDKVTKVPRFNDHIKDVRPLYSSCVKHVNQFLADIRGKMYPVKSELVIGSPKYQVCGMIDQIFYNPKSGGFEIWDWKTNSKFELKSNFHLVAPYDYLEQTKIVEYSLQLHCYKRIFEEETGIEIKNCYLCWFSELQPTYKVFKCRDMSAVALELLEKAAIDANK